jgi:hypothetical protein
VIAPRGVARMADSKSIMRIDELVGDGGFLGGVLVLDRRRVRFQAVEPFIEWPRNFAVR